MKEWISQLAETSFESGKYSQSYQDELISIIFKHIGVRNPVPFCVEFGFNTESLTVGSGPNVSRLVLDENWDSLLLDGSNENPEINLHKHFLTSANICEVFRQHNVPKEPEYISIDVDSTDLWLFEAVVKEYRAMVFSVEYNPHFPLDSAITFPNDPDMFYEGDRGYGASLKALNMVANAHGYSLLWVVPGLDAFFIRNDLIDDGSDKICFDFERWRPDTQVIYHVPLKDPGRAKIFLDYETYLKTGGDLPASQAAALSTTRRCLQGSVYHRAWVASNKLLYDNLYERVHRNTRQLIKGR